MKHLCRGPLIAALLAVATLIKRAVGINNCQRDKFAWYNLDGCTVGVPDCDRGWESREYRIRCKPFTDEDGCRRKVCDQCNSGYFKSGFSRGFATSCTKCSAMDGCTGLVTCTTNKDAKCNGACEVGFYTDAASKCIQCMQINDCMDGELSCSNGSNHVCKRCKNGYYLSSDNTKCQICPIGFWCDGLSKTSCWEDDSKLIRVKNYNFYPMVDSPSNDIGKVSGGIDAYAEMCDKNPKCLGFNSWGWLKHTIKEQYLWRKTREDDPSLGLYIKTSFAYSEFVEVMSDTCQDHGFFPIDNVEECKNAVISVGRTIAWGPHGGYKDVVDGCSARFSIQSTHVFFNKPGICNPNDSVDNWTYTGCKCTEWMPCLCKKSYALSKDTNSTETTGQESILDQYGYCPNTGTTAKDVKYECNNRSEFGRTCDGQVICINGDCDKDKCWSLRGDGKCSKCPVDYAGQGCEHNICRESELGKQVSTTFLPNPSDFDFSKYEAENVQVHQEAELDGDFGIVVSFRPIAYDIRQYRLIIDNVDVGISSEPSPGCPSIQSELPEKAKMQMYNINQQAYSVGTKMIVCLRGRWRDDKLKLSSGQWGALVQGDPRQNPQVCIDYKIRFQTLLTLFVRDLYNTVGVESLEVTISVGSERNVFKGVSNRNGRIDFNIVIEQNIEDGTENLEVIIQNVTALGPATSIENSFELCANPLSPGLACDTSQLIDFNTPFYVEHLKPNPHVFLIDQSAVRVQGRVLFSNPNPEPEPELDEYCAINNALIIAFDGKSGSQLLNTTSDGFGNFDLAVPRNTQLKLEIHYHNHTFIGSDSSNFAAMLLLDNGYTVTNVIEDLEFIDTTVFHINITSAATECMFDIGEYSVELGVPGCPGVGIYTIPSYGRKSFTIEVPAHVYSWNFTNFKGFGFLDATADAGSYVDSMNIESRFNYMFSEPRILNTTRGSQNITFIYHTDIEVTMEVGSGLYPPETFPSTCLGTSGDTMAPFDFALEGGRDIKLLFEFHQKYVDAKNTISYCNKLPEGFILKIESRLGQDFDPCSVNNGGCQVNITMTEYQGLNQSVAQATVFSGFPASFGSENNNNKLISDYVDKKSIRYIVKNDDYFPHSAGEGFAKILLLGNKPVTEDSLVSFFSNGQGYLPLLYLYAPPPSSSRFQVQEVLFDLDLIAVTNMYAATDISKGGGGMVGLKSESKLEICIPFSGCPIDTFKHETSHMMGESTVKTNTISFTDTNHIEFSGKSIRLATPAGLSGDEGDMVLLIGTVAKFISAVSITLNEDSCKIEETPSVVWGSATESLLFLSKKDCEREMKKLQNTLIVNQRLLDDTTTNKKSKDVAKYLVRTSQDSIDKWRALFQHWEDDRQQSKNHKLDFTESIVTIENRPQDIEGNRIYFGASTVGPLTSTSETSVSSVIDYSSTGTVHIDSTEISSKLLLGADFLVGVSSETEFQYTTQTKIIDKTTTGQKSRRTVKTTFVETDAGDTLCVDMYRSPYSGTYIYEVCGGSTMCPHVPGTDARQKFQIDILEKPESPLKTDSGRVVLQIDTSNMIDDDIKTLDVTLELDATTSLFPISFDIGSASLNQPLDFSLKTQTKTDVYILFKRNDASLKDIQVRGNVHSKCDSSISSSFTFKISWDSSCPRVQWGGALSEADDIFAITSTNPDLALTAVNPAGIPWSSYNDINMNVNLYYRLHHNPTDEWKMIPENTLRSAKHKNSTHYSNFNDIEDTSGQATLWLSADGNDIFESGQTYEFELRSVCFESSDDMTAREVGQMRSGPRLGVVDIAGPKLMSWKITQNVNQPTLGFPICSLAFDEAIDCSHQSLSAVVIGTNRSSTARKVSAPVYCTSFLQQLNVVLQFTSQEEVDFWSGLKVDVEIFGIYDVFGNIYGERGTAIIQSQLLRGLKTSKDYIVPMTFTIPMIPKLNGNEGQWILPSQTSLNGAVKEEIKRIVPHAALPFAHIYDSKADDSSLLPPEPPRSYSNKRLSRCNVSSLVFLTIAVLSCSIF